MRVRRTLSLFWAICILAGLFLLYILTDLSYNLPSNKQDPIEADNTHKTEQLLLCDEYLKYYNLPDKKLIRLNKWSALESQLHHIEGEVQAHKAIVTRLRQAVKIMMISNVNDVPPVPSRYKLKHHMSKNAKEIIKKVFNPTMSPGEYYKDTCPVQRNVVPKTDIQMLSMYERILFDDKDGGAWKQGFQIEYDNKQWTSKNKLKVFIVPHSHNDPGWLKTFENYYSTQTKAIFENMVEKLLEVKGRKFIWAEVSFLQLWWYEASEQKKQAFKKLLEQGNLEIVTGGWVMNDEANSHWLAIIQQLTLGHQWLLSNLEYRPRNSWSIDPFGHSSSQPYLLKLAGFENSVIQRVHYRVKKELALDRHLEFKWRQLWDGVGTTDMKTHMMPFYSYDAPHSCGPDPKICCQFDFKRLPGNGLTCPWGIAPKPIVAKNVDERAKLILDQWRKKAQLYRSNAVLIPLGDDFRYERVTEWDHQYKNYEALIEYINTKEAWNVEVQFGTLEDYFNAVHQEIRESDMPVLSGDFFTYADRNQHYWSGYYTSRPFYKNMDRVLLAYLRAAETITSQAVTYKALQNIEVVLLRDRVDAARKALSLFQHHDGITGTSRDNVKVDYGKKLLIAIKHCQSAIQHAAYRLLLQPEMIMKPEKDVYFNVDDIWRTHDEIPSKMSISLDEMMSSKRIVFYNALLFTRREIVTVLVNSPHVEVFDPADKPILSQVSPSVSVQNNLNIPGNMYQLSFFVELDSLALVSYTVSLREMASLNKHTSYSKVRVYNADYWNLDLPSMFAVEQPTATLNEDITVQAGNSTRIVANLNGLIKTIVTRDGSVVPVHMDYVFYGSQKQNGNNSGAYLFMPDGPGRNLKTEPYPEIVVTEGPLKATLYVALSGPKAADILLSLTVYNNPKFPVDEVEISNSILIDPLADDLELAMRFSTSIANGDVFYTDANGMQMVKRQYFDKLPLQANFYPLPAATYIQDKNTRLTVLTSTPLGMAALMPGQIEIMQDRRLSRDDNRGVNQGILDNIRTRHVFKLIVEEAKPCSLKIPPEHPSGFLTVGAHVAQQTLLQPLIKMYYTPVQGGAEVGARPNIFNPIATTWADVDIVMASFNANVTGKTKDGKTLKGAGLTFQRVFLDTCYGNDIALFFSYGLNRGQVYLPDIANAFGAQIYHSSLTFTHIYDTIEEKDHVTLCPMEVKSIFIVESNTSKGKVAKS